MTRCKNCRCLRISYINSLIPTYFCEKHELEVSENDLDYIFFCEVNKLNHKYDVLQFLKDNEGMWFTVNQIMGATDCGQPSVNKALILLMKWESGIECKDVIMKSKDSRKKKDGNEFYRTVRCKMYRYKGC